jgi:hypothetical protein
MVRKTGSEKGAKGFTSWDHLVSMLFCQIGGANSLREISYGLASIEGKVKHLGVTKVPVRSTLSYANANRPWELFRALFMNQLEFCQRAMNGSAKHRFKFKNKLYSLDASIIELAVRMYDWAKYKTTKGAVKLHLLLDHDGYLPVFMDITKGNTHEINVARTLELPKGSIVAMDMGYNDYSLYNDWTEKGVYFVTRLKGNANLDSIQSLEYSGENVLGDELVEFSNQESFNKCPQRLRKVTVHDPDMDRSFVFLTNNTRLSAETIGAIYKDRWNIEAFFKTIKQSFKIKTFVGTSENAVLIQIWTALISLLLLKYLAFKAKAGWSLSNLIAVLRFNLTSYIDLMRLIDQDFKNFIKSLEYQQLSLFGNAIP